MKIMAKKCPNCNSTNTTKTLEAAMFSKFIGFKFCRNCGNYFK